MTDTADKRSAALQVGRPWRMTLPEPDGNIDAFNRSHLAFSYWIEFVSIGTPRCGWSVPASDRVFFVPPNAAVFQIGPADRLFEFQRCP